MATATVSQAGAQRDIPVTVFTGFLGAGKTSLILKLVKTLPQRYKVALLKNEFGDLQVDSELAKMGSMQVREITNGCVCCVLVGQMRTALLEIKEKINPDRIIVETSGSAFPAPIAIQIRDLKSEGFVLDSIATVIDCVNFLGYEDTSYTAKIQAQFTDVILLNKIELATEQQIETVLDHVLELNPDTAVVRCTNGFVTPNLVFGLDTRLFSSAETSDHCILMENAAAAADHHENEIDLLQIQIPDRPAVTEAWLRTFLTSFPGRSETYRVKGYVGILPDAGTAAECHVLNWAFGRYELTRNVANPSHPGLRLVFMGTEFWRHAPDILKLLGLEKTSPCVSLHLAHRH